MIQRQAPDIVLEKLCYSSSQETVHKTNMEAKILSISPWALGPCLVSILIGRSLPQLGLTALREGTGRVCLWSCSGQIPALNKRPLL